MSISDLVKEISSDIPPVISIGDCATEYCGHDMYPYEVVGVKDQKHICVRELGHKLKDVSDWNCIHWDLYSTEDYPIIPIDKEGDSWYRDDTYRIEDWDDSIDNRVYLASEGIDYDELKEKTIIRKHVKMDITFGTANYHTCYDKGFWDAAINK